MFDSAEQPQNSAARMPSLTVGRLRLYSGLVIFLYCVFHFANHVIGIFLVDAMEAARAWIMPVWRGIPGQVLLYSALLTHGGLSLRALYRRRHLKMPLSEAMQLGLGVLIPFLIMEHVVNARIGESLFAIESTYHRLLLDYWVDAPWRALLMALLLVVVWGHACIGIHHWLRYRDWYARRTRIAIVLAVLMPALSLAGFVASGVSLATDVEFNPRYADTIRDNAGAGDPRQLALLEATESWLLLAYLVVILGVLGGRQIREWRARRGSPVRIRYLGGSDVVVPYGLSVLEASRFAGIPHRSVCGGRGRCSTCRIQVVSTDSRLPPPNATERETLARIGAGPNIRLACQLRPHGSVAVQPLVPAIDIGRRHPELAGLAAGRELDVAALCVDLRDSTKLAAEKLPYDALFIIDRYLDTVIGGIRAHDGHIVCVAGDGVMALFGLHEDVEQACREAVTAAQSIWQGIDRLNAELEQDLPWPLRFGIGVHAGISIVGLSSANTNTSIQFLGNTGNVSSRLERLSKDFQRPVIVSERVARLAKLGLDSLEKRQVELEGQSELFDVIAVPMLDDLDLALASGPTRCRQKGSAV